MQTADISPHYVESTLRYSYDAMFAVFFRNNAPKFESFAAIRNRILISGKGYELSLFASHVEYIKTLEDAVKLLLAKIERQDFDSYAEMMESEYKRQVANQSSAIAPLAAVDTPSKGSISKAVRVLWDLENVQVPKKAGFATISALTRFLKSRGLYGSGVDCRITAFFTMGKVSKSVVVDLDRAAVELVWVATKREDADRKLGTRIAQEMAVLPPESTTVIVISSDQDFRTYLQQLTRAGFTAICLHDAPEGNWRRALEMHATESFVWKDVMHEFSTPSDASPASPTPSVDGDAKVEPAAMTQDAEVIPPGYAKVLATRKIKFSNMLLPVEALAGNMVGVVTAWHGPFGFAATPVSLLHGQLPSKVRPLNASTPPGEADECKEIKVRVYIHHSILTESPSPILGKGQKVRMDVELGERGCFARTLQVVAT